VKGPRMKRITLVLAVAGVGVALAVGAVLVMVALHDAAKAADVVAIDETKVDKAYPAGLLVQAKLAEVDLDREDLTMELEFVPVGDDLFDPATGLRDQLSVTISDGSNPGIGQTTVIAPGDQGATATARLDLDGNVQDYPRDGHEGHLLLVAFRESADGRPQELPVILQADGAWPGLDVEFATPASAYDTPQLTARELDLTLKRSQATVTVAYFAIALTWILIITVVGMTLSVVFGQRESQIAMLAFFGTLLFALAQFRNELPGSPPPGSLVDYLAFFWAYAVVIVAVGVIGGLWLYRRSAGRRQLATSGEQDQVPLDPADFS
jgi:hypothetical protein